MSKFAPIMLATVLAFAATPSDALQLQNLPPSRGGPQFTDSDENRPFSAFSEREREGSDTAADRRGPGFHFSISGSNTRPSPFPPSFLAPGAHELMIEPRTHNRYRR